MTTRPRIQFFRNPMGERVAYSVHGSGPPLVCVAWWVSHIEDDWEHEGYRAFFGALARRHTVIRYDRPGVGLSDRDRPRIDADSELQTLGALIDHLGLEETCLLAISCAGPTAIAYASRHPNRVSRLAFFGSYVKGQDLGNVEVRDAMAALVRVSWGIASTTLSDMFAPKLDASERDRLSRSQRHAATADMSARLLALSFDLDAEAQVGSVTQPALVLHRKSDRTVPFKAGRELAASLGESILCPLEGGAHLPWFGDVQEASDAILRFLGAVESVATTTTPMGNCFSRQGDLWRVCFQGQEAHVPHALGLADLATLLDNPGVEIHVGALWDGVRVNALGDQDPIVDELAMESYKQRLRAIEIELVECEERGLGARAEALRSEKSQLAHEVRAAVGLGGRKRALKDVSERARKAVTARIRTSLGKIQEVHEPVAEHLKMHLSTGTYCCYTPPPDLEWRVER